MARKELKSIQDLFDLARGSVQIAAKLNLNQYTVDRWHKTGIPRKYWGTIADSYNVSTAELMVLSEKAKRVRKL